MRDNLLFDTLKFYNRQTPIIDDKILDEMKERVEKTKNPVYWTNEVFAENRMGFMFFFEDNNVYVEMINLKYKFKPEMFIQTKTIWKDLLLSYEMISEEKSILTDRMRSVDFEKFVIDEEGYIKYLFNSFDEMIEKLITSGQLRFSSFESSNFPAFDVIVRKVFKTTLKKPKYKLNSKERYSETSVFHIFDVVEKRLEEKNYRIAFVTKMNGKDDMSREYIVKIYDEDSDEYNYADKGAVYVEHNGVFYYLELSLSVLGPDESTSIDLDIMGFIRRHIRGIAGGGRRVINSNTYRFYSSRIDKFMKSDDGIVVDKIKLDSRQVQVINKYKDILKQGKTIKVDGLSMNLTSIQVDETPFNMKFSKSFFDVIGNFTTLKAQMSSSEVRYNFDMLYRFIIKLSPLKYIDRSYIGYAQYTKFPTTEFIVNDMQIVVERKNNIFKINGIWSRVDDMYELLCKAVCYNDVNEYNKYVKDVSYIGLDYKRIISNGLTVYSENPIADYYKVVGKTAMDRLQLRFSLFWDPEKRSKVYLFLNNKKYLIKNRVKFRKLFRYPDGYITLDVIREIMEFALADWNEEFTLEIVENAIEEGKLIYKKGEQLVSETVRDTSAQELVISVANKNMKGFVVVGRKTSKEYFIDATDLNVFRKDNGIWNRRCVVSDPKKDRIFADRLANRLVNIYNELERISTL